nr:septum site-determining protein MinC [Acidisphaera sp. L21]
MSSPAKSAIRIKGRSFVALVLMPEWPTEDWLASLDGQMKRAPTFFEGRPVIVDFSGLGEPKTDYQALIAELEKRDIRIIGVEGAPEGWTDSDTWGRPPIATNGRADRFIEVVEDEPKEPAVPDVNSLVLQGPIRSGQTVYFERGDVTVLGSVASGAEVIAGGSVHVYGTLRGRVIAGFAGQADAGVFCRRMEAELIAINGVYKVADDMPATVRGKPIHAKLDGDAIVMVTMS